jgi:hypothetical protein
MEKRKIEWAGLAGKSGAELFEAAGIMPGTVLTEASLRERLAGSRWTGDAWDAYVITSITVDADCVRLHGVRRDRWVRKLSGGEPFARVDVY